MLITVAFAGSPAIAKDAGMSSSAVTSACSRKARQQFVSVAALAARQSAVAG